LYLVFQALALNIITRGLKLGAEHTRFTCRFLAINDALKKNTILLIRTIMANSLSKLTQNK